MQKHIFAITVAVAGLVGAAGTAKTSDVVGVGADRIIMLGEILHASGAAFHVFTVKHKGILYICEKTFNGSICSWNE